jgi:hypothetical protein
MELEKHVRATAAEKIAVSLSTGFIVSVDEKNETCRHFMNTASYLRRMARKSDATSVMGVSWANMLSRSAAETSSERVPKAV